MDLTTNIPESLKERYEFINPIGVGGSSQVYKARDVLMNTMVAIKILNKFTDPKKVIRFQREAIVLGKLSHKNIATIFDLNMVDDKPYIVMEYLEGQNLEEFLKLNDLEEDELRSILMEILKAIAYAHSQGVIHRDIKPENIMVIDSEGPDRSVKILDFGIAKYEIKEEYDTTSGTFIGSPYYVSPEQSRGQASDHKSDIYSIGCLVYRMFVGAVPFDGDTILEIVDKHQNSPPPDLSDFDIPLPIKKLIAHCMSKEPAARPETVLSLTEAIRETEKEDVAVLGSVEKANPDSKLLVWASVVAVLVFSLFLIVVIFRPVDTDEITTGGTGDETDNVRIADVPFPPEFRSKGGLKLVSNSKGVAVESNGRVTDQLLKELEGKSIYSINLYRRRMIDGWGYKYLENSGIKSLIHPKNELKPENTKYIARLKSLTRLNLDRSLYLTSDSLRPLQELINLRYLEITSPKLDNTGLKYIQKLKKLRTLRYGGSKKVDDGCVDYLKELPKLNYIALPDSGISSNIVARLKALKTISRLDLNGNKIVNGALIHDLANSNIRTISFSRTDISDEHLAGLGSANKIETLLLSRTEVSSLGLRKILGLPRLRYLDLSYNKIDEGLIIALTKSRLEIIDLSETKLSLNQLMLLANCKYLKELKIKKCSSLTEKDVINFKEQFKSKNRKECRVSFESALE